MKKLCLSVLCLALLLSGCGAGRESQRREAFAAELEAAQSLRLSASLRAEYPEKTVSCRLVCEQDTEGITLSVSEPEELAGVSVRLGAEGALLRCQELSIDAGPLDRWGLSPVSALPALIGALREGHLESAWDEGELTVWELAADDNLTVQVWLDEALIPQRAELISDGRVEVFVEIEDWVAE